jgi:DNA-binding transcriptional ArsR family regulator
MTAPRKPSAKSKRPHRQVVTDARAMRALAHPLRVALLEAVRRDGEITATEAAELLGESPGNMSWHLQTLAKYGFVEEAGDGRGRRRPWRVTTTTRRFDTAMSDPETASAGEALERTFLDRLMEQMRDWWSRRQTYSVKWRRAAFMTESIRYLTSEELASTMNEITAIFDRFEDRDDPQERPAGAVPVQLYAHGHPIAPTPAGN